MKTIREKLKWLMANDNNDLKSYCADKLKSRLYIREKLGLADYNMFVPILGIYDKAKDIDFDALPDRFVLKCNHGSGYIIVCHDKKSFDRKAAIEYLDKCMKEDYSTRHGEVFYSKIQRKIFCEQYLDGIYDYKYWCFNGQPKFFTTNSNVFIKKNYPITFYDIDGKLLKYSRKDHKSSKEQISFNKDMISKMAQYAKVLSKDFKFARIDFIVTKDRFYFGEITFIPNCGNIDFEDPSDDVTVGNMLKL